MGDSIYYLVGFLIIANLGTIWSILYFGGKSIWFFSALKSQVDKHEEQILELKLRSN